jgi:hypothetical protein
MPQPPVHIEPDHVVQRPAQRIELVTDPGDDDEPDAAAPAALI